MTGTLIVAAAENEVIGRAGDLPWRLPADLRRFAALTRGHPVVMGRVTHESILARLGHPLQDRHSIVVSSGLRGAPAGVEVARTPQQAAARAAAHGDWFVIGGARVYAELLGCVDTVQLTRVHAEVDGDARMPAGWLDGFEAVSAEPQAAEEGRPAFSYVRLERR